MLIVSLLLLPLSAQAAVRLDTHPLMPIVAENPGLRQGIAAQLQGLPQPALGSEDVSRFDTPRADDDERSIESRKLALALAVNKDALPQGALSELLGPKAARGIEALAADERLMARNQGMAELEDEAGLARLSQRLSALFENAAARHDADAQFVSESTPASVIEGARLERGTHRERPAVRLTLQDGTRLLAVKVGAARTWDEARALARQPEKEWDLPTEGEMQALVLSGALDVKILIHDKQPTGMHPVWTRSSREAENAELSGTSQAVTLFDPPVGALGLTDVGPQAVARIKGELERLASALGPGDEDSRRAQIWRLQTLLAAIEHGYPVWAVTAKQGPVAPALIPAPDRKKLH